LRNSAFLGGFAFLLIVPFSVALGVVAGLRSGRLTDRVITVVGYAVVALPEFVSGVVLLLLLGLKLGWFPVTSSVPRADIADVFRQLTLPALPMLLILFAYISGIARSGTVETLREDYVRTAILKGLPRRVVLSRHVLRNALPSTV